MLKNFDDMQKYGKDNMDATMKMWGQISKGFQTIAAETADYSKKSFEEGSATLEKLLSRLGRFAQRQTGRQELLGEPFEVLQLQLDLPLLEVALIRIDPA